MNRPPSSFSMLLSRHTRRREFIAVLGGAAAWPLVARAQQPAIPVIGYLSPGSPESDVVRLTSFRRSLNEAGYVEGQNLTVEYRWARDQFDRLPALAAGLVQHQVAVIVALGLPSTLAAKAATLTVPIVFALGGDPVQLALVETINRPRGNLTGITLFRTELEAKRLEMLHQLLPAAASVGLLEDPRDRTEFTTTKDVLAAARDMGMKIQILHASTEGEIDVAFANLARARIDALLVPDSIFFNDRITQLVTLASRHSIPTIYSIREFPLAGGLMSYGISRVETYGLAGLQVARILKGEKPADMPVIQSTKIELVINLNTARALGLTFPPLLLARADDVIE